MSVRLAVESPRCHSTEIVKPGKLPVGKQHCRCQNSDCPYGTFVFNQTYPGKIRQLKQQIVEMTLNGSGVRDITRVLHTSPTTLINEFKKTPASQTSQSKTPTAVATRGSRGRYCTNHGNPKV